MAKSIALLLDVVRDGSNWYAPIDCYGSLVSFIDGVRLGDDSILPNLREYVERVYVGRSMNLAWYHSCLLGLFDRETRVALVRCESVDTADQQMAARHVRSVLEECHKDEAFRRGPIPGDNIDGSLISPSVVRSIFRRPSMFVEGDKFRQVANLFSGVSWARPDVLDPNQITVTARPELHQSLPWTFRVVSSSVSSEELASLVTGIARKETNMIAMNALEEAVLQLVEG